MRSIPLIPSLGLALLLLGALSSCSTWPPRRVPEPAPPAGRSQEPAAASEATDAASRSAPDDGEARSASINGSAEASSPPQAGAYGAADDGDSVEAGTATLAATSDTTPPEVGDATPAIPAEAQDTPAAVVEPAAEAAAATAAHPLGARGSHVFGIQLFGADVAGADGTVLGRITDLLVKHDGTLDCLVLSDGDGRRAYTGVDLLLDDQGDLLLASGERCQLGDPRRDGAPYRELFVGRQTSTVVGQVTAVEALEGSDPPVTVIKLRAANNHHHRVLVGPGAFLAENELQLAVDQEVAIDGIETRDSKGKLWVAGALRAGGRELRLRAGNGEPAWDPALLPIRQESCCTDDGDSVLSAFELARWRVRTESAPDIVACDFVFDRRLEVAFLVVHHEGEHFVPWSAATPVAGRTLSLAVSAAAIADAPSPLETTDDQDQWPRVCDWWIHAARPVQASATPAETGATAPPADAAKPATGEQADAEPSGDRDGLEAPDGAQR